jgi:hypothetical protein
MTGMRVLIGLAAVILLAVGFVLVRPDDDEEATPTTTRTSATTVEAPTTTRAEPQPAVTRITVRVRGGRSIDGIVRGTASKGDRVVVTVGSDVTDHVHVHGYDLFADVGPGAPARISFQANVTGRFEIELEDRAEQIAQLTVVP